MMLLDGGKEEDSTTTTTTFASSNGGGCRLIVFSLLLWIGTIFVLVVQPIHLHNQSCDGQHILFSAPSTTTTTTTTQSATNTTTTDPIHQSSSTTTKTQPASEENTGENADGHGANVATSSSSPTSSSSIPGFPELVWLLSFPNSGTSYTLRIVSEVSNRSTASNYGAKTTNTHDNEDVMSQVLLHQNLTNGPFRTGTRPYRPLPDKYLLTKTHCGSRCVPCGPNAYLETQRSFQRACRSCPIPKDNDDDDKKKKSEWTDVLYPSHLIKKAVHLVRNPLDNVVSRFHLARQQLTAQKDAYVYPNNVTGFQEWCRMLDTSYTKKEKGNHWIDEDLQRLWQGVPCHSEFFEFAQWHNLAYTTTQHFLNLQSGGNDDDDNVRIVRYENYHNDWRGTIQSLLDFLELEAVDWDKATRFHMSSYHEDYYTDQEKSNIRNLLHDLSSVPMWRILQVYF